MDIDMSSWNIYKIDRTFVLFLLGNGGNIGNIEGITLWCIYCAWKLEVFCLMCHSDYFSRGEDNLASE